MVPDRTAAFAVVNRVRMVGVFAFRIDDASKIRVVDESSMRTGLGVVVVMRAIRSGDLMAGWIVSDRLPATDHQPDHHQNTDQDSDSSRRRRGALR